MAGPGNYAAPAVSEIEAGLGLGLPSGPLHTTFRVASDDDGSSQRSRGSYPGHVTHPEQHLVGLGLGLPTDEPLRTSFRRDTKPLIGLGIHISGWEVVDDREDEEGLFGDEELIGYGEEHPSEEEMTSPPLLPTRRESPFRIELIVDDDEFPPSNSIFTPPAVSESEDEEEGLPGYFPVRPLLNIRRPTFMTAPSASELPIPFAHTPSGTGCVGCKVLASFNEEVDDQCTYTSGCNAEEDLYVNEPADASCAPCSPPPVRPLRPFVFPSYYTLTPTLLEDERCEVYAPQPVRPAEQQSEAHFHLPSDLLVSPCSCIECMGEDTVYYETPSRYIQWF
ncbi:hypothetical protein EIP91_007708 [Steccherinum ochraceum]|uniref:Uncharacterized protein n=1 Tax=Steccherinum ochraceum TaxID=92696 RepID=A0A4R0R678_9APHY|nr:hypothetical protein EIP91_007708 [Steccherinum ochraceum]